MEIDGYNVPLHKYESGFLHFTYGSNGCHGGDSGHGCRTIIGIESQGADLRINGQEVDDIQIITGGDGELFDLIHGLNAIVDKLSEIYNLTHK